MNDPVDRGPGGPRIKILPARMARCLRCKIDFPSAGSNERMCPGCKTSSTLRHGLPRAVSPMDG